MGDTFVISGLKNKRARVAGEIAHFQRLVDQRRAELAQIDAVIQMFTPDCNPDMIAPIRPAGRRDMFFSYRETPRMCLDILRTAKAPMRLDHMVDRVVLLKGFEMEGHLRKHTTDRVRATLIRFAQKGIVRRVLVEPDTWWELVLARGNG
jgi:hypothetical protein